MKQEIKVVARTFEVTNADGMHDGSKTLAGKAAGVCYMPDDYMEVGIQDKEKALLRADNTDNSGHHSVFEHSHVTMIIKTSKMMAMILNSLGVYATSEKSGRYTKMHPETELEMDLYTKWQEKLQSAIINKYSDIDDTELSKRFNKWYKDKYDCTSPYEIKDRKFLTLDIKEANEKLEELKSSNTLPSYKLAQENARYMISIFTPTSMEYTVSYNQLFLIRDYLYKLEVDCDYIMNNVETVYGNSIDGALNFTKQLRQHTHELYEQVDKLLTGASVKLHDNKNQYIRFLEAQHAGELTGGANRSYVAFDNMEGRLSQKARCFGDSYTAVYNGSLAMLAQAQRHRTLRYTMCFISTSDYGFYVPDIVKESGFKTEWLNDLNSVAYCIPQATLVRITEQGIFEDFVLKCKERLCGRAQLEVMLQTKETMKHFINNKDLLSYSNRELLDTVTGFDSRNIGLDVCARCKFNDFTCKEGCRWGADEALTRLV